MSGVTQTMKSSVLTVCSVSRCEGAVEGFLGSTVSRVPGPKVSPASVTGCVWTGPTEPECVSVTKVLRGRPVRRVREGSTESTVIRVSSAAGAAVAQWSERVV